jgi:hypothetical protein
MAILVLDGRVAPELGDADQAEEREQELVELGHLAVREDDRPVRVDPHREVVGGEPLDVARELHGGDAVGDRLVVRDQHEQLDAELLEPDAVLERAEQVADVQRPRRPVARQDPEHVRVALHRAFERIVVSAGSGLARRTRGCGGHGMRTSLVGGPPASDAGSTDEKGRSKAAPWCMRRLGPRQGGHDQRVFACKVIGLIVAS